MVKNKTTSVASVIGMLYLLLSVLSTLQVFKTGSHEERIYGSDKTRAPNPVMIETNNSPVQYLGPNRIHVRFNSRRSARQTRYE